MEAYKNELVALSDANHHKYIESVQKASSQRLLDIKSAMHNYFNLITEYFDYNKLKDVAEKGERRYDLYTFNSQDKFEGYPLLFLLKGPIIDNGEGYGWTYFQNQNIVPVFLSLKQHFSPFELKLKKHKQTFCLTIMW